MAQKTLILHGWRSKMAAEEEEASQPAKKEH